MQTSHSQEGPHVTINIPSIRSATMQPLRSTLSSSASHDSDDLSKRHVVLTIHTSSSSNILYTRRSSRHRQHPRRDDLAYHHLAPMTTYTTSTSEGLHPAPTKSLTRPSSPFHNPTHLVTPVKVKNSHHRYQLSLTQKIHPASAHPYRPTRRSSTFQDTAHVYALVKVHTTVTNIPWHRRSVPEDPSQVPVPVPTQTHTTTPPSSTFHDTAHLVAPAKTRGSARSAASGPPPPPSGHPGGDCTPVSVVATAGVPCLFAGTAAGTRLWTNSFLDTRC